MKLAFLWVVLVALCHPVEGGEVKKTGSDSFLKLVSPENLSKDSRLKVQLPKYEDVVYYFSDEKTYTTIDRASVVLIPKDKDALKLLATPEKLKQKRKVEPTVFLREHSRRFLLISPGDFQKNNDPKEGKERFVVLFEFGKLAVKPLNKSQ